MRNSKYSKLTEFLQKQQASKITLRYQEIENVLGFKLPNTAYRKREWWGNDETHTQALSWMRIGWKKSDLHLGDKVTFIRESNK